MASTVYGMSICNEIKLYDVLLMLIEKQTHFNLLKPNTVQSLKRLIPFFKVTSLKLINNPDSNLF